MARAAVRRLQFRMQRSPKGPVAKGDGGVPPRQCAYREDQLSEEAYRVGISGSYGGMNLGDEAILQSIITQLRRDLPVDIAVFSRNAEDTKRRHRVDPAFAVQRLSRT
jgi:hypothetical protein